MLFMPKGGLPPRKSGAGYARGSGASGHWLRARAAVVNTNTDGISRWRHLFNVAKMNYKATQPGGQNTAPINGVTPAEAWAYQAATYIGIVLPGLIEGDLQLMQTLIGCGSVQAYEVMISTTLAQMNQPTPIAPPVTTVKAGASGSTVTATAGTATLAVSPAFNLQVGPVNALFSAALTIGGFTVPTPPAPSGDPWYTAGTLVTQFALLPNTVAPGSQMLPWALLANIKPGTYTFTVTGLPPGITCALDGLPLPGDQWLGWPMTGQFSVTASPTAPPGTYQATMRSAGPSGTNTFNFAVTILDPASYTLALSFTGLPANATAAVVSYASYPLNAPTPAILDGLPNGTNTTFALTYNPSASTLTGQLFFLVTVGPATATGTDSFTAALTGWTPSPTVTPHFTVTTVAQAPGQPCPPFQIPTTLAAHTVLDGDWNVIGFAIFPTYPSEYNDPSQPTAYSLASCWTITASPAYTSGYAAPLPSTYLNILTTGPNLPTAPQLLAAWQDAFGPLPPTGKLKIMLQWIDPLTGAPGPQTLKTLSWQTGTNTGAAPAHGAWPCPTFDVSNTTPSIIAPGGTSLTFTVDQGYNYSGTITFSVKPASYIGTGTPPGKDALPTGLTAALDNPVFVFVDGVPDHDTMTLTLTAIAGTQQFNGSINVQATDSIVTFGTYLTLSIVGDVTKQPPLNFLGIYPTATEIYTPLDSTTALPFDLFNNGPTGLSVSMLTTNTDPDYTVEFGHGATATATATANTITFALATGAATNALEGQLLSSAAYAPPGYNLTDAPILSNTATTVTVLSTNNPAAMTTAGLAAVIDNTLTVPAGTLDSPGTASILAFIEVAAAYTSPAPQIQIVASAGKNTTYAVIRTDSNPGNGFQMSPLLTYLDQPVPGGSTVPIAFSNTNPAPITATLTPYAYGNGVTLTPAEHSVTIPAAAGAVPGTATVNLTITTTAQADLTQASPFLQAIAGAYSQTASILFTDTQYGPLYLTFSPPDVTLPSPGTATATLTVHNASAASATVTLTPSGDPPSGTLTLSPNPITVGPGSTASPATAAVTATLTVPSGVTPQTVAIGVNGAATGYQEMTVPFFVTVTP
jgi:hypothetical protein